MQLVVGEVVVDVLADVEGGDHVERQACDDAERPQRDDGAGERVAVAVAVQRDELAVGASPSQAAHRRREAAVVRRPSRGSRSRPPRPPRCAAATRGWPVPSHGRAAAGATSPYRMPAATETCRRPASTSSRWRQPGDGDLVAVGVREPVERVAGADSPDAAGAGDDSCSSPTDVGGGGGRRGRGRCPPSSCAPLGGYRPGT